MLAKLYLYAILMEIETLLRLRAKVISLWSLLFAQDLEWPGEVYIAILPRSMEHSYVEWLVYYNKVVISGFKLQPSTHILDFEFDTEQITPLSVVAKNILSGLNDLLANQDREEIPVEKRCRESL